MPGGFPETVFNSEAVALLLAGGAGAAAARTLAGMLGAAAPGAAADARLPLLVEHYVACVQAGRALLGADAAKTAALLNLAQAALAACASAAAAAGPAELGGGGGAGAGEAEAEAVWQALLRQGTSMPSAAHAAAARHQQGGADFSGLADGASVESAHAHAHSAAGAGAGGSAGGGAGGGAGSVASSSGASGAPPLPAPGSVGEAADREAGLFTVAEMQAVDAWARRTGTVFVAAMFGAAVARMQVRGGGAAGAGAGAGAGAHAGAHAGAGARLERQLVVETPVPARPLSEAVMQPSAAAAQAAPAPTLTAPPVEEGDAGEEGGEGKGAE